MIREWLRKTFFPTLEERKAKLLLRKEELALMKEEAKLSAEEAALRKDKDDRFKELMGLR